MTAEQKRCLFCEKPGTVRRTRDGRGCIFANCSCAPGSQYEVEDDVFEDLMRISPARKREYYHLLSGYIREAVGKGENVMFTKGSAEQFLRSASIPDSIDRKADKCLVYLYKHTNGPDAALNLGNLKEHYNVTYSPNLQEFVYIIEQLKTEGMLERQGAALSLTPKGYTKAMGLVKELQEMKPCYLVLPDSPELLAVYKETVAPRLRECGYEPITGNDLPVEGGGADAILAGIKNSHLVIADATKRESKVFYEAGYAHVLGLEVIWTVRSDEAADFNLNAMEGQPIVWETPEQLAAELFERMHG